MPLMSLYFFYVFGEIRISSGSFLLFSHLGPSMSAQESNEKRNRGLKKKQIKTNGEENERSKKNHRKNELRDVRVDLCKAEKKQI